MGLHEFEVVLTSGASFIYAFNEKEAVILAQANAIQHCKSYELVSVTRSEDR